MAINHSELERVRRLLCALQVYISDALIRGRKREMADFATISGQTSADIIYHVDRLSETAILEWFSAYWPKSWPVELVMEGLADGACLTFPRGVPVRSTKWKCILDPIDGTRNLMYDKRSAWSLAALAPQRGARTSLGDILVAAMTELPTTKQMVSDQISAIRGSGSRGVVVRRRDLNSGAVKKTKLERSPARDFQHGFASVVKFFPAGKILLAEFEEALWHELYSDKSGAVPIFDDQYLSTGGQIYELLAGHDRMVADLRPLVARKLGLAGALPCHPYDICTSLILQEAGGVVEKPLGGRLDDPLDLTTPVSWIGFANEALARHARPVLRRLVRKFF